MTHTGIVKWFNNKTGYGFLKSGEDDIFVHHQQLNVQNNLYKYLVQGEYVQFDIKTLTEGKHKCMAVSVTGINKGPLMCETRQAMKDSYEANNSVAISS
jgi:cold shock CspA family protein